MRTITLPQNKTLSRFSSSSTTASNSSRNSHRNRRRRNHTRHHHRNRRSSRTRIHRSSRRRNGSRDCLRRPGSNRARADLGLLGWRVLIQVIVLGAAGFLVGFRSLGRWRWASEVVEGEGAGWDDVDIRDTAESESARDLDR
jgi:hypothetical protein